MYPVITLVGSSTKFKEYFKKYEKELTLSGNIVFCLGFFNEPDDFIPTKDQKELLINMMYQKIRMSDKIFVINPRGYIGEHTKEEIKYAEKIGIEIQYLVESG